MNEKTVGTDYEGQPDRPKRKKISSLKKASSTILMVEKNKKSEPMYQLVWQAFSNDHSRAATFNHKDGINHGKIINFLYCDGHAASATYSAWYNTIRSQGDATNEKYLSLHYNY